MALGKMTSLILPYSNTEMMNLFLKHVAEDFRDYFVIMLVDNAGWHRSEALVEPENIRLVYLPPYSPELNPVEHTYGIISEKMRRIISLSALWTNWKTLYAENSEFWKATLTACDP